ncbi:hypothetical protein [Luteolibacter arcticus]|uniref:hypothetical protein n=1 Tax=Luteolibacter arcticus TaxID=1581411 RepID=UPI002221CD1A|nr:hypothetical protein [Luteolibacter arcticus]
MAELECDVAVVDYEVFCSGNLKHQVAAGEWFTSTHRIGEIECTEAEYESYLQLEHARRICIRLAPAKLGLVENLKAGETNEDFVLALVRKELRRLETERKDSGAAIQPIVWQGNLDDDCTAIWMGLMLRAEAMDDHCWWWAVSRNDGTSDQLASSNDSKDPCRSGAIARQRAEASARSYLTISRGSCD